MILIKAGLACNFRCKYCYQREIRPEENVIDLEAVKNTVRNLYSQTKSQIVLHGGEPLFLGKDLVEEFLKLSYDLSGRSSVQTNGYLIDQDFIEIFKKYKTSVGLSIDGPWPCNELRGIGSREDRKKQTEKILENLDLLLEEKIPTSIIVVLHKSNAINDRLEILKKWLISLSERGVTGRLNPCCSGIEGIDLTPAELINAYDQILDLFLKRGISGWSPFRDIIAALRGDPNVVCVFRECDPFHTPAATTVLGDGGVGVCVRLYGENFYLRSPVKTDLRSRILQQTDCKGCEFWNYCYGGCPGMAIDWDWRRKDRWCPVYKFLFKRLRNILKFVGPRRSVSQPRREKSSIEHLDGSLRHLDSDLSKSHSDGIEHLDGNFRHLDSDLI
ncbi:MAG: hypothetical protein DRJ47_09380 [Thermoprotei archaeon]|nr:MAG: hypothetical protein DRJ47_09380 [Thermoprotei archaeon]